MARFLKIYLTITAVLAVLSFVLGPLFSIVSLFFPLFGLAVLALMITPTLFLYGTAFAAVWFPARSRLGDRGAFLAGCAAVTCLGVLPPLLINDDLENEVAWQFALARLSGAVEGVTRIGAVSASRQPHKTGPWSTLTQFEPENCRYKFVLQMRRPGS